ncbi:phosphatidylserine decarboxylase-domain-containing protein [Pisolithus orientalis]|uniref:phosphatidylserine decarboxylase-domain-containing protein n=1 Tax=Pisolithus orientalis TaxID=936130 RepID=UPI00222509B5|nr:phosphatidylserine decarboxylase-domain-containing protein [Pisolithus orientalis]KAI5989210.1 phosphatidylserine decarboxylase-domain-containing protein [Pisolithus orientalis]
MDLAVFVLAPVVQGFKNLIEEDGAVYTAFDEMFRQAAAAEAAVAAEAAAEVAATAAVAVEAARAADVAGAEAAALAAKTAALAVRSAAAAGTAQAARQAEETANAQVQAATAGVVAAQALGAAAAAAAVEAAAATAAVAAAAKAAAAVTKAEAQVEDYVELMLVINTLLLTPPRYGLGPSVMASSVPFYAVISRFCNTHAGYEAFTNPRVNANLCGVFTQWQDFLVAQESRVVLGDGPGGWFSDIALRAMVESAGGNPDLQTFQDFYVCVPNADHYGFASYDAFFTRQLRPNQAIPPDNNPFIIRSACSSTVHRLYTNLRKTERFCIKNTPYSLRHILAGDEDVDTFVGGTLLQAMLGCTDYHRWHSPVNGIVVRTRLISGTMNPSPVPHPTYFAGLLDGERKDLDVITRSQDFVTAISTRALIFIQADDPVGLMCFVAVGLCEVSTCEITVNENQVIQKGDPLGTFRFGGSTHCLIFRRGLNVTPIDQNLVGSKVQVGQDIFNVA